MGCAAAQESFRDQSWKTMKSARKLPVALWVGVRASSRHQNPPGLLPRPTLGSSLWCPAVTPPSGSPRPGPASSESSVSYLPADPSCHWEPYLSPHSRHGSVRLPPSGRNVSLPRVSSWPPPSAAQPCAYLPVGGVHFLMNPRVPCVHGFTVQPVLTVRRGRVRASCHRWEDRCQGLTPPPSPTGWPHAGHQATSWLSLLTLEMKLLPTSRVMKMKWVNLGKMLWTV